MQEKPKKGVGSIIVKILAVLGAVFLVFVFLVPDDEEDTAERAQSEYEETEEAETREEPSEEEDRAEESDEDEKSAEDEKKPAASIEHVSVNTGAQDATVMVYMNGSDLESYAGEASKDIHEMLDSGIGDSANVIIQTMGTNEWQEFGISSDEAETWKIEDGELVRIRKGLGKVDCTSPDTLSEFIGYCAEEYPADRYFFVFWDHGGGPVYGFGVNEWASSEYGMSIAEMARAFGEHKDIKFDIIGMDCCIMANLETCYALAPFCRYTLLSEDFESESGWEYTEWMKKLENDTGISTPLLGKYIIDGIIDRNERDFTGQSTCLGLFNESVADTLLEAWMKYAYKNEDALLSTNYSRYHESQGRGRSLWDLWASDDSNVTLSDYYISDVLALAEGVDMESDEAKELVSALKACVAYYGHTSDKNELTGMAVSLPYGDPDFYDEMKKVYTDLGLDAEYVKWLGSFVSSSGYEDYYDYGSFEDDWGGWGSYDSYCEADHGDCEDDWTYDFEDGLWYLYEEPYLYCYDESTDEMYCYDEEWDMLYRYDDATDEWYEEYE